MIEPERQGEKIRKSAVRTEQHPSIKEDRRLVMSSPVNDNIDKRAMYAPPWAREAHDDEDNRRVQAEIASAAERLKGQPQSSRAAAQQIQQARRAEARADAARTPLPEEEQFDIEDAIRDAWVSSRLDPVRMPPPPKADGPTWGMLSRLTGAAGFAVIVALFVTGAIPMPSINISLPRGDDRAGRMVEQAVAKPETGRQAASVPTTYAAQPTFVPRPAPPLPSTVGAAMSGPVSTAAVQPVQPAVTASVQPVPQVEPPRPPQGSAPQTRLQDYMPTEEMDSLLKRGTDLLSSGDVAGGRLLLTRAAEAGDARASLTLAGTYDAPVMGYLGVVGVPPDAAKARAWYMKAAAQGSPEAARRLERLAGR